MRRWDSGPVSTNHRPVSRSGFAFDRGRSKTKHRDAESDIVVASTIDTLSTVSLLVSQFLAGSRERVRG